jgi:outer membrane protein TolC
MVETRVGQQMARFSLSQMFPWFGTLAAQKDAAALVAEAQYASYLDARNELSYNVRATYFQLYELQEAIKLHEEHHQILSTYKSLATTKFQNGIGKLADALRADIMMNDIKTELIILNLKRKPLQVTFNNLLNRPPEEVIVIQSEHEQLEASLFFSDSLFSQNPKLRELDRRIESEQAREQAAIKQGMPNLGIGFEYIIVAKRSEMNFEDNGKDAYMPMVTVSLPIYRKKYKAAVNEAQHMQQAYVEMKTSLTNNLLTEYEMALFEQNRAKAEMDLYDQQIKQTDQIVSLLVTAFSNSGTDFEEILMMQQTLLKYKIDKVSSHKNLLLAEAKLTFLVANEIKP